MRQDAKLDRLAAIPLFADTERRHLQRIAQMCTEVDVPAGQVLCREGEVGREFFIIEEGTVEVTAGGRQLATLGPGDFFGELALLDGKGRNATVTSTSPMRLLVLNRGEFGDLMTDEPTVAVRMLPAIGARLRARAEHASSGTPVV